MARAAVSTQLARDQTARQLQRSSLGGSPPDAAGPLRIGAAADDTFESLKQLGVPLILCRIPGSWPAWGIHRPSGLFIATFFDADNRLEAIEFGRPNSNDDAVTSPLNS